MQGATAKSRSVRSIMENASRYFVRYVSASLHNDGICCRLARAIKGLRLAMSIWFCANSWTSKNCCRSWVNYPRDSTKRQRCCRYHCRPDLMSLKLAAGELHPHCESQHSMTSDMLQTCHMFSISTGIFSCCSHFFPSHILQSQEIHI